MTAGFATADMITTTTAAKAATMPVIYTTHHAGYVTGGGRHFRVIATSVKVSKARTATQYASVILGGANVTPVYLAVKAGGGAGSVGWSVGSLPFGMGGGTMSSLSPAIGDSMRLAIYYDQKGHVSFTAVDNTTSTKQTVSVTVPASTLYTAAEAAVLAYGYTAPVANDFQLWAFASTAVTTYSGVKGTLIGPWITSKVVMTSTGGSTGAVLVSPNSLWNNGANFGVWRR